MPFRRRITVQVISRDNVVVATRRVGLVITFLRRGEVRIRVLFRKPPAADTADLHIINAGNQLNHLIDPIRSLPIPAQPLYLDREALA